ncbi:hypothetical protein [Sphingomonas sp. BK069]|uniref:hypothetical protein n=1 Tax=Sphingomonas sp. BK069 TaxID=2586979 RepID=UPI00160DE6BD|nr:hypothetical protein [Sphingomonas sp. BK069]MBB3349127.1 hypothetical protein [Sphingomonas sp. BK069]
MGWMIPAHGIEVPKCEGCQAFASIWKPLIMEISTIDLDLAKERFGDTCSATISLASDQPAHLGDIRNVGHLGRSKDFAFWPFAYLFGGEFASNRTMMLLCESSRSVSALKGLRLKRRRDDRIMLGVVSNLPQRKPKCTFVIFGDQKWLGNASRHDSCLQVVGWIQELQTEASHTHSGSRAVARPRAF